MELWQQWLMQFGCPLIVLLLAAGIVGLPVPDETLLVTVGVLIHAGRLPAGWAIASCIAGSVGGITLSYLLGRGPGWVVVREWGSRIPLARLTPERIARVHTWFARYGKWALTFGYFVPGVRHFTALAAGASRLSFGQFALFAYAGATVWSVTFVTLGYLLGPVTRAAHARWATASGAVHGVVLAGTIALIAAAVVALVIHRRWRSKKRR